MSKPMHPIAPKVSIIIPVYNVEKYLRQCLDSVLGQACGNIEVICIDDGSTDHSDAILDEYAARDARVCVIHQENAGAGAARNRGIARARGEYLFFCDPDDWCGSRMLVKMYEKAKETRADVVIAPVYRHNDMRVGVVNVRPLASWPSGVFKPSRAGTRLFRASYHTIWDKLFRREFVIRFGLQFQTIRRFNDIAFCDLALALAERITTVRHAGYHHRVQRAGGLQSGKDETPELFLEAYDALRSGLERHGVFAHYREAYANALFFSGLVMMFKLSRRDAYVRFYRAWIRRIAEFHPVRMTGRKSSLPQVLAEVFDLDMSADEFSFAVARTLGQRLLRKGTDSSPTGWISVVMNRLRHWF